MNCRMIRFPAIKSKGGSLAVFEGTKHIPFKIKRVFFVYDLTPNVVRGEHALKNTQEFIVALQGSCDILVDDGKKKKKFHLNCPYRGFLMPAMTWIKLENFSADAICVVCTSGYYDKKDYIGNYKEFKNTLKEQKK